MREGELLRGGVFFGNFWLSMTFCEKTDFRLFLSLGAKSPVFLVLLVELVIVLLVARA